MSDTGHRDTVYPCSGSQVRYRSQIPLQQVIGQIQVTDTPAAGDRSDTGHWDTVYPCSGSQVRYRSQRHRVSLQQVTGQIQVTETLCIPAAGHRSDTGHGEIIIQSSKVMRRYIDVAKTIKWNRQIFVVHSLN